MTTNLGAGVGVSVQPDTAGAVSEAVELATRGLGGGQTELAFITCTVEHDAAEVVQHVRERLPNAQLHGITTSLGVLGSRGVASGADGALGVLLLRGDGSTFVSRGSAIEDDAAATGRRIATAVADASRGRVPKLLLFNASPGVEEDLLAGIADVFPGVPAYGGSAADHAIAGGWSVLTAAGAIKNGVTLTGVFGDVRCGGAFMAPYEASGEEAVVSSAGARRIQQLGGARAADGLREWVGPSIAQQAKSGGNILAQTALTPIGIRQGEQFIAVHPAHIHPDGSVDVFARVADGTTVCRLRGTDTGLIEALPQLIEAALGDAGIKASEARAAILIYCAGCAAAVGDLLHEGLSKHFSAALPNVPTLGVCTFGEQGLVPGVGNLHSNLSLGLVVFG
jgi:hypothetical protein